MIEQTAKQDISNGVIISVLDAPKSTFDNGPIKLKAADPEEPKWKFGETAQPYVTMFIAELLGTGLLMFLGCMGCINNFDEPPISHHFGSITFGLTVMLIIQCFGHISGAHLNPAVTIATVLFRMVTPLMAVVYIMGQFVGATLGYGLLKILLSEKYAGDGFCATLIDTNINTVQGFGIEVVITTVLIIICCAVWDKRNETKADSVALRFGFAIAAISLAAGPLTGASMNTARSFAPLVFGGTWDGHWVYWVAPNIAAFLGCGIYKFVFSLPEQEAGSPRESIYLNDAQTSEKV